MPSEQVAMFEVEAPQRALLPEEKIYPADAKWTAWKGAHHPCEICGLLVLQMGMQAAPPVAGARWKRKGPNRDQLICSPHMQELKPEDDKVVARLDALRGKVPGQRKPAGQRRFGS